MRNSEPSLSHRSLPQLISSLTAARDSERLAKGKLGATADFVNSARWRTLTALEEYVAALEALTLPVPRTILQELRLHRSLCGQSPK